MHEHKGVPDPVRDWALNQFKSAGNGFRLVTYTIPDDLPSAMSGLYGPSVGDDPVEEGHVHYKIRGNRKVASRMVDRPARSTCRVTVCGIAPDGPVYSMWGGEIAPREPGDTSIPDWDGVLESRHFWAEHALSSDEV